MLLLFGAEFIGIEKEPEYMEIAKHRIDTAFDILKKFKTSQELDELDQIKLF